MIGRAKQYLPQLLQFQCNLFMRNRQKKYRRIYIVLEINESQQPQFCLTVRSGFARSKNTYHMLSDGWTGISTLTVAGRNCLASAVWDQIYSGWIFQETRKCLVWRESHSARVCHATGVCLRATSSLFYSSGSSVSSRWLWISIESTGVDIA